MSWFKIVKRVLRSPSKVHEKKSSRRGEECEAEEEEKKWEKKRWLLGRSSKAISSHVEQTVAAEILEVQTRHALAAAATAEAAAAEIVKLARRPSRRYLRVVRVREEHAAVIIQAAFRGYLARRAFHALRGLVKLQALVRGDNVRKQTKVVLKYMQTLVRVQERLLHQQSTSLNSHHTNNISWESKHQILNVNSPLKSDRTRRLTRENRRSIRNKSIGGQEADEVFEDRAKWLDGCPPAATPWDNCNRRASADNHSNSSFSTTTSPIFTKRHQHYHHEHHHHHSPLSPLKTFKITSYSAANTPALPRRCCMPNYMASTESAKARARSSPGAGVRSERGYYRGDGSTAKKRLSYNLTAPETESLKSPSFKSLPVDTDYSCYSVSQLLSPSSTTDLRWLN